MYGSNLARLFLSAIALFFLTFYYCLLRLPVISFRFIIPFINAFIIFLHCLANKLTYRLLQLRSVSTSSNESKPKLYFSSVNESRQRLIKFMLSVGATESAAILEQSPGVFVKFDKF